MKSGSKFNQDILGKSLRDDAKKWNIDPSASSSRETLASVRKAFREPQTGKGPALMPAFAAAMALVLIIAVVQTLKGPDASVDKKWSKSSNRCNSICIPRASIHKRVS